MSGEIWVAIITGAFTLAGVIITVVWGNRKNAERSKAQTEVTLYRIGELEKKQDKYNNLQERTFKDERDIAVMKEDIKAIREKIDYLHGE
jgi:peptidoglycan hydrolase CwlO-like protein